MFYLHAVVLNTTEALPLNSHSFSKNRMTSLLSHHLLFEENPEDYPTFNDFFMREIKPEKRPVADPNDDSVVVCAADCRLTVFDSLEECKNLWIKGTKFSFEELLNNDKELVEHFKDGVVANFRLAPQDYHRYHSPVAGRIVKIVPLPGETFSVVPKALESNIDVLGRNERDIIVIQTQDHGKVCYVPIGVEGVGKVVLYCKEGQEVKKGEEIGAFSYGGSDIVILFENPIEWDKDIREHSVNEIETLIKCNDRIGKFKKMESKSK